MQCLQGRKDFVVVSSCLKEENNTSVPILPHIPILPRLPLSIIIYFEGKNKQTANNKYKEGTAQPRPGAEPRDSQPGAGQTPGRPSHGAAPAYKAHQDAPGSVIGAPQVAPPSRPDGATQR